MTSRLLLGTLLLGAAAVGVPAGHAAPDYYTGPLTVHPLKACAQVTDAPGDANPTLITLPAVGAVQTGQDPALDIRALSLRTAPTTVDVFLTVDHLNHFSQFVLWSRFDFISSFTVNGKVVSIDGSQDVATTASVGGVDATSTLKPNATFDFATNEVVLSVSRAGLASVVGALPNGTPFTAVGASTTVTSLAALLSAPADSAGPGSYTFGDNTCFVPPPGQLSLDVASSGQYTDEIAATATLRDAAGQPLGGELLTASTGSGPARTAITDDVGVAHFSVPITTFAQDRVHVSWAGDNEVGPAQASSPFTVTTEHTVLTATPGRGTVKATLLDDDGHGVANQRILFTLGSRNFVLTTGTSGETVLKVTRGTLVKVSYAGLAPYFSSAPSASARAA